MSDMILVGRQPVIPPEVKDFTIGKEYHSGGHYWVFFIQSSKDGVNHWAQERRKWGMPAEMIADFRPDAIEYYREICPFGEDGEHIDLVLHNGVWYWRREE